MYHPNGFARKHGDKEISEYIKYQLEEHQDDPNHRNRTDVPGAGPAGSLGVGMGPLESKESAARRAAMVRRLVRHWDAYLRSKKAGTYEGTRWIGNRPDSANDFAEAYDAWRALVWYYRGLGGRSRDYY